MSSSPGNPAEAGRKCLPTAIVAVCVAALLAGGVAMFRTVSRSIVSARARAGAASIASALPSVLPDGNDSAAPWFPNDGSGGWQTLPADRYHPLLDALETRGRLDLPPDRLDPWGAPYQIRWKHGSNLLFRVSSPHGNATGAEVFSRTPPP